MTEQTVMAEETAEETLDPEDWESMRVLGHRILDDMIDYLETLQDRLVWQHAPHHVKAHFRGSPPAWLPKTRRDLPRVRPVHTPIPIRK
jgi:hypothetical protein